MNILLTGASGFIAQTLVPALLAKGFCLMAWSQSPEKIISLYGDQVKLVRSLHELGADCEDDAIINLAGEGVADKRWSDARKQSLLDSRIKTTEALVDFVSGLTVKPSVFLSGSAVGFYGSQASDEALDECSSVRDGFTHQLCLQWEAAALGVEAQGVRTCLLRTGIVLGQGGALKKILLPFQLGLGGPVGTGEQWMSWIHIEDEISAIIYLLENSSCSGAYNLTTPTAVKNKMFTQTLAGVLRRPACLPLPRFVPQLLLGEGAGLLLDGQRVYPKRLMDEGFRFKYLQLDQAMAECMGSARV